MIGIFKGETSKQDLLLYNGDYLLDSICVKLIEEEGFGDNYGLDSTFIISGDFPKEAYDLMKAGSWLKVDGEYGKEYFKITQVSKNSSNRRIDLYSRHATISEALSLWCEDVRPTNTNGAGAISWIFNNAKGTNFLDVSSDITRTSTAYYINKTVYDSLFTVDNSFLNKWGGEIYRRGLQLSINNKVGEDRGVVIRSRKNLKGVEVEANLNNLVTRIYPKGFDGITINEKYVDSPLVGNYDRVYSQEVKFEDVKVKSEENQDGFDTLTQAQEELKKRAKALFDVDGVDKITSTYRVDFVQLERTEEYKNFQLLENTWLGDTVKVIDETLNLDISVRVIKREYDCLRRTRTKTELSNKNSKEKPPTIKQILEKLENIPDEGGILAEAKANATALINAGISNSYVLVRENEILIMDTKDVNTAQKIWRWNNNGLGYSSTGYYGTYGTAITNDGKIVANFITTGVLNANLIKAGVLRSVNNITSINLENGQFNFGDKLIFDGQRLRALDLEAERSLRVVETTGYSPQLEFYKRRDGSSQATLVGAIWGGVNGGLNLGGYDENSNLKPIDLRGSTISTPRRIEINAGGEEGQLSFNQVSSTPTNVYFYGGSRTSPVGVGLYDSSNNRNVARYLPASNEILLNSDVIVNSLQSNGFLKAGGTDVASRGAGWVRFYDGTQICYGSVVVADSVPFTTLSNGVYTNPTHSSKTYTFPVAFAVEPVITIDSSSNGNLTSCSGGTTTTSFVGRLYTHSSITISWVRLLYVAIGRWK